VTYIGMDVHKQETQVCIEDGAVTKAGNTRLRWLLVQAAGGVWRDRHAASQPLRTWADALAARRGKGIAGVALLFRGVSPVAAEAFASSDPYVTNGVVTRWRVREWTTVVGADAEVVIRNEDIR
jgi:hypothetical protein